MSGVTGVNDLYLKFTGGSSLLFNVNYWQFTSVDGGSGGAGAAGGTAGSAGVAGGGVGGSSLAGGAGDISGSGNVSGSGDVSGAGGSGAGSAGTFGGVGPLANTGGSAPGSVGGAATSRARDNSGCSCAIGAQPNVPRAPIAAFIVALLALGSRRRRAPLTRLNARTKPRLERNRMAGADRPR